MPNDNPMNKLLYAILSQKCLKDIDWNVVATHPILGNDTITNGHAARMRYSRFKKQMEAANGVIPLSASRPRKPRVEKNRSPKKPRHVKAEELDDVESIKAEGTSELRLDHGGRTRVKHEHGELDRNANGMLTPGPVTPAAFGRSQSPTPSPTDSFSQSFGDEILRSFELGHGDDMYGAYGLSTGLSQDMGVLGVGMSTNTGLYGELAAPWDEQSEVAAESVAVKREERWDEGYAHPRALQHHA